MNDTAGSLATFLVVVGAVGMLLLVGLAYAIRYSGPSGSWRAWSRRRNRVLIVVAQPFGAAAMRAATAGQRVGPLRRWRARLQGTEYLATYSRAQLHVVTAGPGDTVEDAARCLSRARPDLVILAGVCRGLHPERQSVGDVVLGSVLRHVETDPTAPAVGSYALTDCEEAHDLLVARLRMHDPVTFEGVMLCHSDLPQSWTFAEDLAKLDPHAIAACHNRSNVYATAARLDPHCAGWAAVGGVAWYGQHRTPANNHTAAANVAGLIVTTAKSSALNYR